MRKADFGETDIRLTEGLTLNVEWNYYAEERGIDRDVPSEPAIYEIDSVWLHEKYTNATIDVTDLEGTLWEHDKVLQIIESEAR
jgi:hypothetical protein